MSFIILDGLYLPSLMSGILNLVKSHTWILWFADKGTSEKNLSED